MAAFTIQIHLGDVVKTLTIMEAAFDDASDLMDDVLLVMIRSVQQDFEAEGRPSRWQPLAQSTIDKRLGRSRGGRTARNAGRRALSTFGPAAVGLQNRYFNAVAAIKILRDTGAYAQSIGAGASGAFSTADGFGEADKSSAVIGTNNPAYHNEFPDSRGYRPAREVFVFLPEVEDDISEMAVDWFMRRGPYAA